MAEKTFEALLASIDEILQKLEHQDLELEASLKLYEDGMAAYREAQGRLVAAKARLEQVVGVDAEGNVKTAALDVGVEEADTPF